MLGSGVEFALQAVPVDRLSIALTLGYLDDEYVGDMLGNGIELDLSFTRFPYAPKWTSALNSE